MSSLQHLLDNNRNWAAAVRAREPEFFPRLAAQQAPRYLWIGCSDSRVPANEIVDLLPGELFVHRNVANVVVHTDLNCLSVLQFAVDVLRVEHVMVVGHYGCGGVQAAWQGRPLGLIDNWLRHVQDVAARHLPLLEALPDDAARVARLCELNVVEQVVHVARTTIVQDAWRRGQRLTLHGWIYGLADGILKNLGIDADSAPKLEQDYRAAVRALA
jgi:carbonic anhydrase